MIEDATDIVCDTGPIIHLDELGCLDLLAKVENYPREPSMSAGNRIGEKITFIITLSGETERRSSINRHISEKELPELQKLIEEREKCRKEIRAYKKRMAYLEKLLNKPNPGGGRHESAAR